MNKILKKIKRYNKSFSLKTRFYISSRNEYGWTRAKTIFLNINKEEVEKCNIHELLHHFANTKQFEKAKQTLLSCYTKQELYNLQTKYMLRYYGVYSKQEIESGILDEEITINLLCGFEQPNEKQNQYIDVALQSILSDKKKAEYLKNNRHLKVILDRKIRDGFSKLSKWEMYYVQNYYPNGLPTGKQKYDIVKQDIENEYKILKKLVRDENAFEIDLLNNPEIEREYLMMMESYLCHDTIWKTIKLINREFFEKQKIADCALKNQYEQFRHIVKIIKNGKYKNDHAFIVVMLKDTLAKLYKQDFVDGKVQTIVNTRVPHISLDGHMNLNSVILNFIYKNIDKYSKFSDLYFDAIRHQNKIILKKYCFKKVVENEKTTGVWLKFPQNKNGDIKEETHLSCITQQTQWCTKTGAAKIVRQCDFYLFVSLDDLQPKIGISVYEGKIIEERGTDFGKLQVVPEQYKNIAKAFIKKYDFDKSRWLEQNGREKYNRKKIAKLKQTFGVKYNAEVFKEYVKETYVTKKPKNEVVENILSKDLVVKEEVFIESAPICNETKINLSIGYGHYKKFILKDMMMAKSLRVRGAFYDLNLGNLRVVKENLDINSAVKSLGKLEVVYGDMKVKNNNISSEKPISVVGDFDLNVYNETQTVSNYCPIKVGGSVLCNVADSQLDKNKEVTFKNLNEIGKNLIVTGARKISTNPIAKIAGNVVIKDCPYVKMSGLSYIGKGLVLSGSEILSLGSVKQIESLEATNSIISEQSNEIEYVEKNVDLENSTYAFDALRQIGGNLNLKNSKARYLFKKREIIEFVTLPQLSYVFGDITLEGSDVTCFPNLKFAHKIVFGNDKLQNMDELMAVDELDLSKTKNISGLPNLAYVYNDINIGNGKCKLNVKYIGGNITASNLFVKVKFMTQYKKCTIEGKTCFILRGLDKKSVFMEKDYFAEILKSKQSRQRPLAPTICSSQSIANDYLSLINQIRSYAKNEKPKVSQTNVKINFQENVINNAKIM